MLACKVVWCLRQSDCHISILHYVTRPSNSCEGGYSKRGTDAFYFCSEVLRQYIENRPQTTCVSPGFFFLFLKLM